MTKPNYTIADYGDFEIHISKGSSTTKETVKRITQVETKYRRKRQMVDKGLLSKEAAKKIEAEYRKELKEVYVDCIIVGWKGKFKDEELPAFTRENALKFFEGKDKEIILVDITEVSLADILQTQAEDEEEINEADAKLEEEEIKN